nr:MAG TPA: hypothetical protein [Bacteriophage sp.]
MNLQRKTVFDSCCTNIFVLKLACKQIYLCERLLGRRNFV